MALARKVRSALGLAPPPMIKARRDVFDALRSAVGRQAAPFPSSAVAHGPGPFRWPWRETLTELLYPLDVEFGTTAASDERRLLVALNIAALVMASGDPAPMDITPAYHLCVPEYINEFLSSTRNPGESNLTDLYRKFEDAGVLERQLEYLRRSLRLFWATEPLMRAAEREEFREFHGKDLALNYEVDWGYQGRVKAIAILEAFVIARSSELRG